ncbi:Clp protease N-terminal domain-containing protein [Streptomyces sp. NPDC096310]|uniref:Clp protease N-terminal domain-containing protein n=1 Tax=Streptomyces sp. NPDC096310 TaxID=3366082 RepID=UPI00382D8CBF
MQKPSPLVPVQPAPERAGVTPVRAAAESRLTAELVSVLSGARRRALRVGDAQVDTAHLLHSLLETDPRVREVFGGDQQVVRVLGYLVQRSIGYGLRWQATVEDSGSVPAVPVPRGAADRAVTGWSPQALAAMAGALDRAARRGEPRVGGIDLLAALLADRDCRAVEVLERAGAEAVTLERRLARLTGLL